MKISSRTEHYAESVTQSGVGAELPPYSTSQEVAEFARLSVPTLNRWRAEGKGPKATRFGARAVRFKREDVLAWIDSLAVSS